MIMKTTIITSSVPSTETDNWEKARETLSQCLRIGMRWTKKPVIPESMPWENIEKNINNPAMVCAKIPWGCNVCLEHEWEFTNRRIVKKCISSRPSSLGQCQYVKKFLPVAKLTIVLFGYSVKWEWKSTKDNIRKTNKGNSRKRCVDSTQV